MKKLSFIFLFLALATDTAISQTLAEKLGYSREDKLLIIHADDIGLSHGKNVAVLDAMKNGVVNSGSIMVPCPWVAESGKMHTENPELDWGLHLTLTNEWFYYKWGTVASDEEVPGLQNELGFMYADCASVAINATGEEVEKEITAQVEQAMALGIKPTHLDSHMGCIFFGRPEYLKAYLNVANKYRIPAMLTPEMVDGIIKPNPDLFPDFDLENYPVVDAVVSATQADFDLSMEDYYVNTLKNLQSGVNVLLIHAAYDDLEMQGVTVGHKGWHSPWRQNDYDFFTGEKVKDILRDQNIKLVTWREIGKLLKP